MAGIASQIARGVSAGQAKGQILQTLLGGNRTNAEATIGNKGSFLSRTAKAIADKKAQTQGLTSDNSSRISSIESRLDTLEGGGNQDVTQPSPTVSPAPVAGGEVSGLASLGNVVGTSINDATPPAAQAVAQDVMGEEFLRNAAVGAAKMIEGKKINK
jgi:hypothetical protein